ncbi:antitermination regulator, partial [Streptomyces sp. WAC 06725]|uniref:GAF and ANTAR domain-containing protein n=1 Tax=Streptomyces sp. WAC 06725 TaxID=2203209 RepID=UPI000F73F851
MSPFEHVGTPSGDDGSPASEDGPGRGPSVPGGLPVPSGPERGPASSGARPDRTSAVGRLAATVERLRSEVQAAHAAADGRALIELAKGIMVERLRCGPAQATRQLAELAEKAAVSQLELAVDIINQAARDRVAEIAGDFLHRTRTEPAGTGPADAACATVGVRLRTAESAALAAGDAQAVADSLLQHALSPLGATAVAIWTAGSDTSLTLAGHAGFPADEAVRWRYVPPGVVTVARQALTERDTVQFASLSETGIPSIGRTHHPHGGRVALPAGTGGRIHGVLEICWQQPLPPQPPVIMRQIEALAELCAHALETAPASYGHGGDALGGD